MESPHSPTIAVVVPNKDDRKCLSKCLDSIIHQSVLPDQIVYVDDDSIDDSICIAEDKLRNFGNSVIIKNSSCLGCMGSLNEGLKHVNTDYVLFLSSNDYLLSGIIKHAKSCIADVGTPGLFSAMVYEVDEAGGNAHLYPTPIVAIKDTYLPPEKCIQLAERVGSWFHGTTIMFHRKALQGIGGFDISLKGLADLQAALLIASLKGAVFSPEPHGVMRIHGDGCLSTSMQNLTHLENRIVKIEDSGQALSPRLFTDKFIKRFRRRLQFSALRTLKDGSQISYPSSWHGTDYQLLKTIHFKFQNYRKTRLTLEFLVLRPFDLIPTIWYRLILGLWIRYGK